MSINLLLSVVTKFVFLFCGWVDVRKSVSVSVFMICFCLWSVYIYDLFLFLFCFSLWFVSVCDLFLFVICFSLRSVSVYDLFLFLICFCFWSVSLYDLFLFLICFSFWLFLLFFQLETTVRDLHQNLNTLVEYQTHLRLRESQGRSFAEDLNERVQYWSIGQSVVILLAGMGQILILRSFFSEHKRW